MTDENDKAVNDLITVVLDWCLTFHKHVSMVAGSWIYRVQTIHPIGHFIVTQLAQTLACTELTTAMMAFKAHQSAPSWNCSKFRIKQLGLYSRHRGDPTHAKPLLHQLHWLPVQQRITYKLAGLMYKIHRTFIPVYLLRQVMEHVFSQTTFICNSIAGPTFHQDRLSQAWFLLSSTVCLELAATSSSVLNPDLKLLYACLTKHLTKRKQLVSRNNLRSTQE